MYLWADLVQRELELGDHTEVAAAPADRPEQVGMLLGGGADTATVRQDHGGGDQVVATQPELFGQPAHAAAECQPADAGVTDNAAGHGEPVSLGRTVHVGP